MGEGGEGGDGSGEEDGDPLAFSEALESLRAASELWHTSRLTSAQRSALKDRIVAGDRRVQGTVLAFRETADWDDLLDTFERIARISVTEDA